MNCEQTTPPGGNRSGSGRAATNRKNAAKSTGPKSAAGKALVATNGIGHGIFAISPVIEGVESAADWKRYRRAMLASLMPGNAMEATVAEKIILTAWRLRRVVRYETTQICSEQAQGAETTLKCLDLQAVTDDTAAIEELLSAPEWREHNVQTIQSFNKAGDAEIVQTWENSYILLRLAYDHLDVKGDFEAFWTALPDPEGWTVGRVRQVLGDLIKGRAESLEDLMTDLEEEATLELAKWRNLARKARRELDEYQSEHLLPDESTIEKILRYEAHLSRQFHRDLNQLQRLQAMRLGLSVPAPVTIDVDVSGGEAGKVG